ncbi:MAG: hypothetical protein QHH75_03985 [Bacillota bacterium]|nr:hypothetical protein [Bacillota bacterium]
MDNNVSEDINALIVEKLSTYSTEVRELAIRAVQLSETLPEATVADQLLVLIRKLARSQESERE